MKSTRRTLVFTLPLGVVALRAGIAHAQQQITGAGSTFVYPVLSKWSAAYSETRGVQVNYQAIGSGAGIAQIKAGTVDFGASDAPLSSQDLRASGLAQFPIVIGGIVPVVNLQGLEPGQLRLTGPILADIFLGTIKSWDHQAIAQLNPDLRLPSQAITIVHRSDGSGTTFNFADYLCKVSPTWKRQVGRGTSIKWPAGVGGKGNAGVAAYVERIKGAIGYVEYAYVVQNKMPYALLKNAAGGYPQPSIGAFQAAAASANWQQAPDFDLVMTDAPGKSAYPIAATTFVLMRTAPKNPAASKAAIGFFAWSWQHGQQLARSLDYVPLPTPLVKQVESYIQRKIHFR